MGRIPWMCVQATTGHHWATGEHAGGRSSVEVRERAVASNWRDNTEPNRDNRTAHTHNRATQETRRPRSDDDLFTTLIGNRIPFSRSPDLPRERP